MEERDRVETRHLRARFQNVQKAARPAFRLDGATIYFHGTASDLASSITVHSTLLPARKPSNFFVITAIVSVTVNRLTEYANQRILPIKLTIIHVSLFISDTIHGYAIACQM